MILAFADDGIVENQVTSGFINSAPYLRVNIGNNNVFSVNEKVTVQLNLTPTSFGTISYNTRILAGAGTP